MTSKKKKNIKSGSLGEKQSPELWGEVIFFLFWPRSENRGNRGEYLGARHC